MVATPLRTALSQAKLPFASVPSAPTLAFGGGFGDAIFEGLTAVAPTQFPNGLGSVLVSPGSKTTFRPIVPAVLAATVLADTALPVGANGKAPNLLIEVGLEGGDSVTFDFSNPTQGCQILYTPKGSTTATPILLSGATMSLPATLIPPTLPLTFRIHGFRPEVSSAQPSNSSPPPAVSRLAGGFVRLTMYDPSVTIPSGSVALVTGGSQQAQEGMVVEQFTLPDPGTFTAGQIVWSQLLMAANLPGLASYVTQMTATTGGGGPGTDGLSNIPGTPAGGGVANNTQQMENTLTATVPIGRPGLASPGGIIPPVLIYAGTEVAQPSGASSTWNVVGPGAPKAGDGTVTLVASA